MNAGLVFGTAFVVAGVVVFAIGAVGVISPIQIGIGIFLAVVGAITLKAAAGR